MTRIKKISYGLIAGGGLLLACLWFMAVPALSAIMVEYPSISKSPVAVTLPFVRDSHEESRRFTVALHLQYSVFQSGIVRFIPDDCLTGLQLNGDRLDMKAFTSDTVCYPGVLTLDLSPYLRSGDNHIVMEFSDHGGAYGVDVKPLLSSMQMLAATIALCAIFYGLWLVSRERSVVWYGYIRQHPVQSAIIALLLFLGIAGRMSVWGFQGGDFSGPLSGWLNEIQHFGMGEVYGRVFANYAPLYTYFLGIGDVFFPTSKLDAVKWVSTLGDVGIAAMAYLIVKRHGDARSISPVIAGLLLFANPVSIANSASAGQCDALYTLFVIITVYALFVERPFYALLAYGVAISFKFQAIFLSPFLLLYVLNRQIPWRLLWVPAAVYVAIGLPCWFQGREMMSVLRVYWDQFNSYDAFGNVGNFYYNLRPLLDDVDPLVRNTGLGITVIAASLFAYVSHLSWRQDKNILNCLLLATFCTALMPFLLPKMLDRYFFVADMLSLFLICFRPRWILLPLLFQAASILVYPVFTFEVSYRYIPLDYDMRQLVASILHLIAIIWLAILCYRRVWRRSLPVGEALDSGPHLA